METTTAGTSPSKQTRAKKVRPEKTHAVIRLAAKRNSHDCDDVPVGHNGKTYQFQREEIIPVEAGVMGVLRDAAYPHYKTMAGEDRKVVGHIQRFPFEVLAKTTAKQHAALLAMLKDNERLTEEDVEDVLAEVEG